MTLKASYRRTPSYRWEGVLKDEKGNVVWACGHSHKNRDYNHSVYFGRTGAAMYCAQAELKRREPQPSQCDPWPACACGYNTKPDHCAA